MAATRKMNVATRKMNVSMRKMNVAMRKTRKQAGGKRKLSPALKAWNKKVMDMYHTMKKKNPNTKLKDAMKAAKRAK